VQRIGVLFLKNPTRRHELKYRSFFATFDNFVSFVVKTHPQATLLGIWDFLMSHAVDDVVHTHLVGAARHVNRETLVR
jgi:hypothetical protein